MAARGSQHSEAVRQLEQLRAQSRRLLAELRQLPHSAGERLLSDAGNLRPNPAKTPAGTGASESDAAAALRSRAHRRALPRAGSRAELDRTKASLTMSSGGLGYDWMMSSLENGVDRLDVLRQDHSEVLQRVLDFRRAYRNECISDSYRHEHLDEQALRRLRDLLPASRCDDAEDESQPRAVSPLPGPPVYAYTVNERLFPVPLNLDTVFRGPPTKEAPAVVQVSIPRGRIKAPSRVLQPPHGAAGAVAGGPGDSMSLHGHCNPGYRLRPPDPAARPAEPAALVAGHRRAWRRPDTYKEAIELVSGPRPRAPGSAGGPVGREPRTGAAAGNAERPPADRAIREGIRARMRHLPSAVQRPDDLSELTSVPVLG